MSPKSTSRPRTSPRSKATRQLDSVKLFLSWSGERSRSVAEGLKEWLRDVFHPEVSPWVSSKDMEAGVLWERSLASELEESKFGILCLTPEGRRSPWLLFEAGVLAKWASGARLVPYLIDLPLDGLPDPLKQFQAVEASEAGTWQLVRAVNGEVRHPRQGEALKRHFKQWWPRLESLLAQLPPSQPERSSRADLPAELSQTFAGRQANLGQKQQALLRLVTRRTRKPGSSIEQSAILEEFSKEVSRVGGSELYYRLEQLRLLGFVAKESLPNSHAHRYRTSAAYQAELDRRSME